MKRVKIATLLKQDEPMEVDIAPPPPAIRKKTKTPKPEPMDIDSVPKLKRQRAASEDQLRKLMQQQTGKGHCCLFKRWLRL